MENENKLIQLFKGGFMAVLNVKAVKVPSGVTVTSFKTQVVFEKHSRRVIVKGHVIELSTAPKTVSKKYGLTIVSKEEAVRRHLGPTMASGKVDTEKQMATLLNDYFR
jgi:Zn-dependent metalloprotease